MMKIYTTKLQRLTNGSYSKKQKFNHINYLRNLNCKHIKFKLNMFLCINQSQFSLSIDFEILIRVDVSHI